MNSFESLRNIIISKPDDPVGAKKEKTRTASEIVKDKKDSQYFIAFLTQCGDDNEVREVYRKYLAHEPLTAEESEIIGDAVRQFEENIKIADELYERIYRSPYFESFFEKFETTYNHVVTPKEFKKQFLDHLRMLAVTGGDAVRGFAQTFDAYTKTVEEADRLEIISERIRTRYNINHTRLSGFIDDAKDANGTLDKAKLMDLIKDHIWRSHPDSPEIFNDSTTTPKQGKEKEAEKLLDEIKRMADELLMATPTGKPIEEMVIDSGKEAATALKGLYSGNDVSNKEAVIVFTEALSEIAQTGKVPKKPKQYSAKKVRHVQEETPLQFSQDTIEKMRVGYESFKKELFVKYPGYQESLTEDDLMDRFFAQEDAKFDGKPSGGKRKIGWLERFLRTVRNTYLKGKIKSR